MNRWIAIELHNRIDNALGIAVPVEIGWNRLDADLAASLDLVADVKRRSWIVSDIQDGEPWPHAGARQQVIRPGEGGRVEFSGIVNVNSSG